MRRAAIAISTALIGASVFAAAAAQTQDRYGPAATAPQTASMVDTPTLTWPGKAAPEDMAPAPPPAPAASASAPIVAMVAPAPPAPPSPAPRPPAPPPTMVAEAVPAPPPPPVAPAPAPAQTASIASAHPGLPPHFYSVDRQYGVQPDPTPLPAQFFADLGGSDLAAPPPPLPPHPVPGAQSVTSTASANTPANRARAIEMDTASPDDVGN